MRKRTLSIIAVAGLLVFAILAKTRHPLEETPSEHIFEGRTELYQETKPTIYWDVGEITVHNASIDMFDYDSSDVVTVWFSFNGTHFVEMDEPEGTDQYDDWFYVTPGFSDIEQAEPVLGKYWWLGNLLFLLMVVLPATYLTSRLAMWAFRRDGEG